MPMHLASAVLGSTTTTGNTDIAGDTMAIASEADISSYLYRYFTSFVAKVTPGKAL